jgi:sulfur-oxidizing protein SoxZ
MTQDARPRVRVPKSAKAGEVVTIKAMITHIMETGQRKDAAGNPIPRSIINRFTCDFNGVNVIDVGMEPAVSANPFFEFDARVDAPGEFTFAWHDDTGAIYTEVQAIEVA